MHKLLVPNFDYFDLEQKHNSCFQLITTSRTQMANMQLKSSFVANGAGKQSGWPSNPSALVSCSGRICWRAGVFALYSSQSRGQDSDVEGRSQHPVAEPDACGPR